MNKFLRWILAVVTLATALAFIWIPLSRRIETNRQMPEERARLVICTSERDEVMNAVVPLFEEKYDIQVHLIKGEKTELLERIHAEGNSPEADLIMGLSLSDLYGEEDLFLEYVSVNDKYILPQYRNISGFATGYVLNGSCLVLNQTLARGLGITGYSDLLQPDLTGRIIMANPSISFSGFQQLYNILLTGGGAEDKNAWLLARRVLEQAGKTGIVSSSDSVHTSVAKGEYLVGLASEDACANLMREGADIQIVYPREGSLFVPQTAAILKNAAHPEYARFFLDFLTGKDMQDIFGTLLTSRPVRRDAKTSQFLTDLKEIPVITEDESILQQQREQILERYLKIWKEITEDER